MGLKTGAKKQLIVHERNIKSNDNSKFDIKQTLKYNKLSNKQEVKKWQQKWKKQFYWI